MRCRFIGTEALAPSCQPPVAGARHYMLDWIGLKWNGLDWIGENWIGSDWIELGWIGLNWIGLDWIGCYLGSKPI